MFMSCRYDYEECAGEPCNEMMNKLQQFVDNKENIGKEFKAKSGKVYKVSKIDNFEYTDPIDNSVTKNQVRGKFNDFSKSATRPSVIKFTYAIYKLQGKNFNEKHLAKQNCF